MFRQVVVHSRRQVLLRLGICDVPLRAVEAIRVRDIETVSVLVDLIIVRGVIIVWRLLAVANNING